MIAIAIREPGGPEVLTPVERPLPAIGGGDVLIKVAAAGVNRPDLMQRQGKYPPPPGAPDTPGLEVAGNVEAVGAEVHDWHVGDRVAPWWRAEAMPSIVPPLLRNACPCRAAST